MEPFKNLISAELVACIAFHVTRVMDDFDADSFTGSVTPQLGALELKERVQLIADQLTKVLPDDVHERSRILGAILSPVTKSGFDQKSDEAGIAGWGIWPLSLVVGQHGLNDFSGSLELLREMTKRSTAEFAIRYFLIADQVIALAVIAGWIDDESDDVRRLISEGTRPRLPWGMQLPKLMADPSPILPLLEKLKDDPSDYVRRSVANHLNDISKDNPEVVLAITREWIKGASKERLGLLRHACRSLLKAGHPDIMALFGFNPVEVETGEIQLNSNSFRMGEDLEFSISIQSASNDTQKIAIDYVMHFQRANGRLSAKVFKGGVLTLKAGETAAFRRSFKFRPITTRRYYSGRHGIAIRLNGTDTPVTEFNLIVDSDQLLTRRLLPEQVC